MRQRIVEAGTLFTVLALAACKAQSGHASDSLRNSIVPPSQEALESVVDSLVAAEALQRGVPGIAVAIVASGRVVIERGYGLADVASVRAVTATTPFNIASISKPFTAALVLMLAREGRVDLDAPARTYVSLPSAYRDITVRQLLTHTSGIARDLRTDNDDDPNAAEYRRRLDASQPGAAPGARFQYSNTGYTVLGWLVEAIEGRPLEAVLRSRIFEPNGLHYARYRATLEEDSSRARPHEVMNGITQPTLFVSGGFGSGGISLSASDFAAFGVALQRGTFLPAREMAAALTPGRLKDGSLITERVNTDSDSYGFGWFISRFSGRRLVTHGGGITGYSANLYHFPDDSLTIAVLANAKARDDGRAPVDPLARRLAELYLSSDATGTARSVEAGMRPAQQRQVPR